MADTVILKEFLAVMGYRVDETAQRRFLDGITNMTAKVLAFSAAMSAAAAGVVKGVFEMADAGERMKYFAERVGDTVTNIDAFVFAMSKMGLSPQEAMQNLQKLGDMLRNDPGMRGLWESYAGKGPLEEQLRRFQQAYKNATPDMQRIMRQQFGDVFDQNFFLALGRNNLGPGEDHYKQLLKRFGFDPDRFAEDAHKFENSWRELQARINMIWGRFNDRIIGEFTSAFDKISAWMDQNSDKIISALDKITDVMNQLATGVGRLFDAFMKLTPEQKEVVIALFVGIAAALALPGFSKITLISAALGALLLDFERFKETGKSEFGIDWDAVGRRFDQLLNVIIKIKDAFGGWLHIIEAIAAIKIAVWVVQFTAALTGLGNIAITARAGILGIRGAVLALRGALLLLRGLLTGPGAFLAGLLWPNTSIAPQSEENKQLGGSLHERFPGLVTNLPVGPVPGTNPNAKDEKTTPGLWEKVTNFLSYLNPISAAKAEELPENVKKLNQSVLDLNDTLKNQLDPNGYFTTLFTGGMQGNPLAQGGYGGGGKSINLNDPKVGQYVRYLMSKGVSMVDAIAIVSTAYSESGLNPTATNPTSGAYGMFQWLDTQGNPRQTNLMNYAKEHDRDPKDPYTQLDFALSELHGKYKRVMDRMGDTADVAEKLRVMIHAYEAPGPAGEAQDFGRGMPMARALMGRGESLANNAKNVNLHQSNNVTIHGATDPNATARALQEVQDKYWGDITRNLQGAFQ